MACADHVANGLVPVETGWQGNSTQVIVIGFSFIAELQGPFPESVSRAVNRLQQTLIFRACSWWVKEVDLCRFGLLRNLDADTDEPHGSLGQASVTELNRPGNRGGCWV